MIANLPTGFNDPSSPDFQKVHVRGVCFSISPTIINSFLDRAASPPLSDAHSLTEELVMESLVATLRPGPLLVNYLLLP